LAAQAAGIVFTAWTFILVAVFILTGNIFIYRAFLRPQNILSRSRQSRQQLVAWQAAIDGAALWAVTYFSGGVTSPLAVGFLLPVFFVAVLLPTPHGLRVLRRSPRRLVLHGAGRTLRLAAASVRFLPWRRSRSGPPPDANAGHPGDPGRRGVPDRWPHGVCHRQLPAAGSGIWSASRQTEGSSTAGCRGIFSILETIGSVRDLNRVLETAVSEVALVMQVKAPRLNCSARTASFCGMRQPRSAGPHGPGEGRRGRAQPLNKRIIQGEPFVTGQVTATEMFQFRETLAEAHLQSVLFVPLNLEGRVIASWGLLRETGPLRRGGGEFFPPDARLVAIAVENARAYEAVTAMSGERTGS